MSKRLHSKYKVNRRLGENIWGNNKSPVNRYDYGPGQHGQKRKNKLSDFGTQLKAKQKLKFHYGNISEKQFRNIYILAEKMKGDTSENLIGLLERRLDSIIYRAKFVPTVFAARQFINHGHIKVNNIKVNISSYKVKPQDIISIKKTSQKFTFVIESNKISYRDTPDYLSVDYNNFTCTYLRVPTLSDVPYPVHMEPNLVIEFYSR